VRWPGGEEEVFAGVEADGHYHLVQHSGKAQMWMPPEREGLLEPSELSHPESTHHARIVSAAQLPLPPLEYKSADGQKHWLQRLAPGQPVLVNLWASWCRPCVKELKELAEREAELREAGVVVIALSVDRLDTEKGAPLAAAAGLLKNVGYTGHSGWATAAMAEKLELVLHHLFDLHQPMSVPTSLLIDSTGQLAVLYRGPVSVDQLLADVAKLPGLASSSASVPFEGHWHTQRHRLSPLDVAWQLVEHGYLSETIDYISKYKSLLHNSYNMPKLLVLVGNGMLARGEAEHAIAYYREAMSLNVNYGEAKNNLAWVLATHPNQKIRDGEEALRLITEAVKEKGGKPSSLFDTLAAAYAEEEQFEKAVVIAKQAIVFAMSGAQYELAKRIERRLKLYEARQPYRDK
jgi:thiol-disulfide isomerase/thioredoxin